MKIREMAISTMIIAFYVAIMYVTQSFAFGPVQVRLATALYALAYFFPFLIIPLGLANFLANLFGGLGIIDMAGGCIVGIVTAILIYLIKKFNLNKSLIILPIILIPGLGVAIWLSYLYEMPYFPTASMLMLGQIIPALLGRILIAILEKHLITDVLGGKINAK